MKESIFFDQNEKEGMKRQKGKERSFLLVIHNKKKLAFKPLSGIFLGCCCVLLQSFLFFVQNQNWFRRKKTQHRKDTENSSPTIMTHLHAHQLRHHDHHTTPTRVHTMSCLSKQSAAKTRKKRKKSEKETNNYYIWLN